ncbi:MAG: LD-carboxypeptidase [Bacteroidales bacterium]
MKVANKSGKIPPPVKPGDIAAIVAPAGKIGREVVEAATETLKQWGLEVKKGRYLFGDTGYFSAPDDQRLDDLQTMLDDPEIRLILCARGGYGSARIVDRLNLRKFQSVPKWIVGFSDITALLLHIYQQTGICSVHGPMAKGIGSPDADIKSAELLKAQLFGVKPSYRWENGQPEEPHTVTGRVLGGNLAILCSLIGTASMPDMLDAILFIEDTGEPLYRIDRMLNQLKRAGILEKISGLLLGTFDPPAESSENTGNGLKEIVYNSIENPGIPVAFNFPAGHTFRNYPLIIGARAKLTTGLQNTLEYL